MWPEIRISRRYRQGDPRSDLNYKSYIIYDTVVSEASAVFSMPQIRKTKCSILITEASVGDTEIFPVHSFAKTDACADRLLIREPRIETDNE